jgi:hypothetical protein
LAKQTYIKKQFNIKILKPTNSRLSAIIP